MLTVIRVMLVLGAAWRAASSPLCLRVDSSSDATFSFSIEQSIEGMKGRIADVKTASPHAAARPFARLDGTLTLTRVCAAGGMEGG